MGYAEIQKMFNLLNQINIYGLKYQNEDKCNCIFKILTFIGELNINFSDILVEFEKSNVRYCDYYDQNLIHGEQISNYFLENYNGLDKEQQFECFILYALLKNVENIIYNINDFDYVDELYEALDMDNFFEDIEYLMDELNKIKETKNTYEGLPFMHPDKKYKIMFSGYAYDDIKNLEKQILKALINKLDSQLSSSDIITLSESIDHVKDRFGMPICRVQFADDYRITYYRKDGVTSILGVTLKTGKPIDYTRYDNVASKQQILDEEIKLFNNDSLPYNADHYKTISFLEEFYYKNMSSGGISNS